MKADERRSDFWNIERPVIISVGMRTLAPLVFFAATLTAGDVTGKWTGTVALGDGESHGAYVELQQKGSVVTGVAGSAEEDAHAIRNGKIEGDTLTFEVVVPDDRVFKISLKLVNENKAEGTIEGAAEDGTKMTGKLSISRAPAPAAAADLTGTWIGTAEYETPGGTETSGAHCIFKQNGSEVTGTAGPNEGEQMPLKNGKFENGKLSFEISVPDGPTFKIEMLLKEGKLEGKVDGTAPDGTKMPGKLSLTKKT